MNTKIETRAANIATRAANIATRIIHRAKQTQDFMWLVQDKDALRAMTRKDAEALVSQGKLNMRSIVGIYNAQCPREWIEDDVEYVSRSGE